MNNVYLLNHRTFSKLSNYVLLVIPSNSQSIIFYVAEKYTDFAGLGKTPEERSQVESVLFWSSTTLLRWALSAENTSNYRFYLTDPNNPKWRQYVCEKRVNISLFLLKYLSTNSKLQLKYPICCTDLCFYPRHIFSEYLMTLRPKKFGPISRP